MAIANSVTLSITKEEKTFFLIIPGDTTYGVAFDAAFSLLQELMELQKKSIQSLEDSSKKEVA